MFIINSFVLRQWKILLNYTHTHLRVVFPSTWQTMVRKVQPLLVPRRWSWRTPYMDNTVRLVPSCGEGILWGSVWTSVMATGRIRAMASRCRFTMVTTTWTSKPSPLVCQLKCLKVNNYGSVKNYCFLPQWTYPLNMLIFIVIYRASISGWFLS